MRGIAILLVAYLVLGVAEAAIYRYAWRGPFAVRHALVWPVLLYSLGRHRPPPAWMKPAPADVAARELDEW